MSIQSIQVKQPQLQQSNNTKPQPAKQEKSEKRNQDTLLYGSLAAIAAITAWKIISCKKQPAQQPPELKQLLEELSKAIKTPSKDIKIKKGVAYNLDGSLFTGVIERESSNSTITIKYINGKRLELNYKPKNDNNIAEVNRLYNDTVDGIKLVDTRITYKNGDVKTKFEIIEKNKKFSDDIEKIIPKRVFDGYLDKNFLSKYPCSGRTVKRYDLGNGIIITETPINGTNKISRTLTKDQKLVRQIEIENVEQATPNVIKYTLPENKYVKINGEGGCITDINGVNQSAPNTLANYRENFS